MVVKYHVYNVRASLSRLQVFERGDDRDAKIFSKIFPSGGPSAPGRRLRYDFFRRALFVVSRPPLAH